MIVDIVVIGSGVAGTALVEKILGANPKASILMLEAGGKVQMRDFGIFQNYMVTGKLPQDSREIYDSTYDQPYPDHDRPGENVASGDTQVPLNGSRMFAYGGSTGHWGGWSFRLKPEDFRLKSRLAAQNVQNDDVIDWPISYDDLEPFYSEAEEFIGVAGDSADPVFPGRSKPYPYEKFPFTQEDGLVIQALEAMEKPVSYSHLPIARHGFSATRASTHSPCQTTGLCKYCPFGARFAAANYLDDLKGKAEYPNFRILNNTIALRILLDSRSRASGVEYLDAPNGKPTIVNAGTIVIASGAVEAPKLLMASAEQDYWKDGIGNDNDLVGRFLVTHPYFFFRAEIPADARMPQPQMGFPTLVSRHFDSEEEQSLGKYIVVHPASSPKINLAREMKSGMTREAMDKAHAKPMTVQLQGIVEVFSQYDNRVTAVRGSRRVNRFGIPQTSIHHSRPPDFDTRMNQITETALGIFRKMGATNATKESVIDMPVSWRADHAACTTRMSDSPSRGVVDRDLKVHGMDNLYICSNSTFSSLGAVNPTLTLTALSLRLGKHLLGKLYNENP